MRCPRKQTHKKKPCEHNDKQKISISDSAEAQSPDYHNKGQKKIENWDNIYRGALPLPDDLLERNSWNMQQDKQLVEGKVKEYQHMRHGQE